MKKLTLKNLFISLSVLICMLMAGVFSTAQFNVKQQAYAEDAIISTQPIWKEGEGGVPYALYSLSGTEYTNYESGAYVLLSSSTDKSEDAILNAATVYVRFNRQKTATEGSEAQVSTASLNVNATLNGKPIAVSKNEQNIDDAFVEYPIALRTSSTPMYWNDGNLTPIAIEDRVGEYDFTFIYRYTINGVISDLESVVNIKFTLINRYDYFKDESSYTINYADKAPDAIVDHESYDAYAYNFNKYTAGGELVYPVVTYNAGIFALNYTFTAGNNTSFNYIYKSFNPIMSASEAMSQPDGTHTGNVVFELEGTGQTFSVKTYKKTIDPTGPNIIPYNAEMQLTSFGDYKFGVDLLVSTAGGYIITEVAGLSKTTIKYLTIYGYELTYKDQEAAAYLPLANEITHADIVGSNPINEDGSITPNTQGYVPTLHPITDQAPLKFNYNVTELNDKKGKFKKFTTIAEAMTELQTSFMEEDAGNPGTYYFLNDWATKTFSASATYPTLDYIQGSQINMDGVYLMKLDYTIITSYGSIFTGSQMFLFEINNKVPETIFQAMDQYGNISEIQTIDEISITNQNIRILVKNNENAFNAPVSLTYTRYSNFDDRISENRIPLVRKTDASGTPVIVEIGGDQYYTYTWDNTRNYAIPYNANGRYIVTVTYNPSMLSIDHEYFVDSTPITNINIYDVQLNNGNYLLETTTVDQIPNGSSMGYDMSITNKTFSINWAEKKWASRTRSGLSTTIDCYYVKITDTNETVEIVEHTLADESTAHLLTNGYSTSVVSSIPYMNSLNALPLNEYQYQASDGIYLFHVKDYAGNDFYRMIMKDSTQLTFIQESYNEEENIWINSFDPINNQPNFVKTQTRVIFGDHKAIVADFISDTPANTMSETFKNYFAMTSYGALTEGATPQGYVIIPITAMEVTFENAETGAKSSATLTPKDNWLITLHPNNVPGVAFAGEQRYLFKVTAKNGSSRNLVVEMNFDNASGQYWASGWVDENGDEDNTSRYIMTNRGTNLSTLTFKYKDTQEGMYKIAKVSYRYYAFNYDAGSTTYPFSTTPTDAKNFTLPTEVNEDGYYHISNINMEDGKTRAGKYILTRTYVGGGYDEFGDNSLGYGQWDQDGNKVSFGNDKYERSYTVYVDHNGIISSTYQAGNVREVGENISITLGKGTSNQYTFKNFFRSVSAGTPILTTNKLPVQINIPLYKYFVDNGSAIDNVMCRLDFALLELVVTYQNTTVPFSPLITYNITTYSAEGYFNIPEFTAEGLYTISIIDHTGYSDLATGISNINPMKYFCSFVIAHTAPSGNVYVNEEPMTESTVQENFFATNASAADSTVEFVWSDAVDPYTASVVEINITANETTETINFELYDVDKIAQGIDSIDLTTYTFIKNVKIEILDSNEFEFKVYTQHKYTITLNIDEEIDYIIEIRYAPTEVTDHGYGDFVSTSYRVKIDRTKPLINIDSLIDADSYLVSSSYYTSKDNVKEKFKEEGASNVNTSLPTIYDYAFSVDSSYTLTYDGEDTVPEFYFRKYRKYEDQNQSLTPDHPSYNSLADFSNYPRFNYNANTMNWYEATYKPGVALVDIIRQTTGMNANAPVTGFYEIIEKDLAGNYRAFTVYFLDRTTLYNILNIDAKNQSGNAVTTNVQEITQLGILTVNEVYSTVGWGTLVMHDLTHTDKDPISTKLTPYLSYNENYIIANNINDFLVTDQNARYEFAMTSSSGLSTKYVNTVIFEQKIDPPIIVKNSDGTYFLQYPTKEASSVIYLTSLQLVNSEGQIIDIATSYDDIPAKSANLQEGVYIITYTDNFNSAPYSYTLQLGVEYVPEEEKYVYDNNKYYEASNGTIYAGGDIRVTYQSKVHSITISTNNGNQVSADTADFPNIYEGSVEGFKTIVLKQPAIATGSPANVDVGGQVTYTVYYNDKSSGSVLSRQNFVIYNKLPAINLYDNNNASISGSTSGGSMALTSSAVKINWVDINDAPHSAIYESLVVLHTMDETGQTINSIEIDNNRVVTKPGYYMVEICNKVLGNYRTVSFAIQDGDIPFYTVIDNETRETLLPSSIKLDILNNYDLSTGKTLLEQIKSEIPRRVSDEATRTILNSKLLEAPTQIEQYYSLHDAFLQKDASSELQEMIFVFEDGAYKADGMVSNSKYKTTIYLIYGINNPIYANLIAVTKVPERANILTTLSYPIPPTDVGTLLTSTETTLTNQAISDSSVTLTWNSISANKTAWYNSGNLVYLNYNYNSSHSFKNFGTMATGMSSITISGTGRHLLTFQDIAGNTHVFTNSGSNSSSYNYHTLTILDKIIYKVNNDTPLNYMTFNGDVTISLDQDYVNKYNKESIYITVNRNGVAYDEYVTSTNGFDFTFVDSGRYSVTLHAKYSESVIAAAARDLTPVTYNFTIIEKTSARLAYEFNEMLGYEITKIYKDNRDITAQVKEYYIKKELANIAITPDAIANYSLKEFFATSNVFGNGSYQLTVAVTYNELLAAKEFTYSFKINNTTPVILSTPGYGETTKGEIILTYNPSLIYQQVGKSYIKIYTFNKDTNNFNLYAKYDITSDALASNEVKTATLTQTNDYYIQVETDSGNVITSFRVNRAEPLNALSIIVIVVGSIVAVVLIILFIKLRTKMKVK